MSGSPTGDPINYEQTLLTAGVTLNGSANGGSSVVGGKVPVDTDGTINTWNLPKYLLGPNAPQIWYDTGHRPGKIGAAPSMGEHSGGAMQPGAIDSFDVTHSATDIMKQFAAMSQNDPMQFAAIQKQLEQAGFYGAATTVYGGWNKQTEKALADAMVQYLKVSKEAAVPVSFVDFVTNTANANQQINGNTPGGAAPNIPAGPSLADPNALRTAVQTAAQNALGRNLSDDELTKFVDVFHGDQTSAFNTAQAGGSAYTQPSASDDAAAFVKDGHGTEIAKHQATGYTDAFLNMFLSGASAPPPGESVIDPVAAGV